MGLHDRRTGDGSSWLGASSVTVDRLDDPEGPLPTEDDLVGYRLVRWFRIGDRNLEDSDSDTGEMLEEPPEESE